MRGGQKFLAAALAAALAGFPGVPPFAPGSPPAGTHTLTPFP